MTLQEILADIHALEEDLLVSSQCFGENTPPRRGLEQVSPSY
jgi:hypothetical protein